MKIIVKDPETGDNLELEAMPAEVNQQEGWSVLMPMGQSIFITLYHGHWEGRNNKLASAELVNAIGKAINPSSVTETVSSNHQEGTGVTLTEIEIEKLLRK